MLLLIAQENIRMGWESYLCFTYLEVLSLIIIELSYVFMNTDLHFLCTTENQSDYDGM